MINFHIQYMFPISIFAKDYGRRSGVVITSSLLTLKITGSNRTPDFRLGRGVQPWIQLTNQPKPVRGTSWDTHNQTEDRISGGSYADVGGWSLYSLAAL